VNFGLSSCNGVNAAACAAKTPSKLISLDFKVPGLHAHRMIFLLMIVLVQFLTLIVSVWFNRAAWIRILVLRQQLAVYKRKSKKPMLRNRDRLFWSLISRIWNHWRSELFLVKPETVIRWRERNFREFWRKKSQNKPGRPSIPNEHIDFIRRISSDHPEYGEDRIALELEVKFGIRHACSTVRRYMVKRRPGPRDSQAWRSFLKKRASEYACSGRMPLAAHTKVPKT
jgi:putative transposase